LVVPVDIALLTRTCEAVVATVRATAPTRRGPRIAKLGTRESAERKTTRTAPRAAGKPPIIPAERVAS